MPFISDIPIDCAAVDANPLAYHSHDVHCCTRLRAPDWAGVSRLRSAAVRSLLAGPLRGEAAQNWLRARMSEEISESWTMWATQSGVAVLTTVTDGPVVVELAPEAKVLSLLPHMQSYPLDRVGWTPSWADDFNAWVAKRHEEYERMEAGAVVHVLLQEDMIAYAHARGYAGVSLGWAGGRPPSLYLHDLSAVDVVRKKDEARDRLTVRAKNAYLHGTEAIEPISIISNLSDGIYRKDEGQHLGFEIARPHIQAARRYLDFVTWATDRCYAAVTRRDQVAAALDVVLGLRRWLATMAMAFYAGRHPGGRMVEMAARMMPVPGPAVVGRVRPKGMEDWPDAMIDLALSQQEPVAPVPYPARECVDWIAQVQNDSDLGLDLFRAVSLPSVDGAVSLVAQVLESPEINWQPGARGLYDGAKLY